MKCIKCGFDNPEGSRFCGNCGTQLAVRCDKCGTFSATRFCPNCGNRLIPETSDNADTVKVPGKDKISKELYMRYFRDMITLHRQKIELETFIDDANTKIAKFQNTLNVFNVNLEENYEKELKEVNSLIEHAATDLVREQYSDYKKKIEDRHDYLRRKKQEVKDNKNNAVTPAEYNLSGLLDERAKLYKLLEEKERVIDEGFNKYDIVYKKYRNITAYCSFYDYFDSGRTDTLEGADGAYNIFENESRLDSIVSLNMQSVKSMNELKEVVKEGFNNQTTLLKMLNESINNVNNTILYVGSSVIDAVNRMESRMSNVEYYSGITASNTGLLTTLSLFDALFN